jgi:hypothetical protein
MRLGYLQLPVALEARLARIEARLDLLADELDVDLEVVDIDHSPGVRHGMPHTWHEYQAHCRRLADEASA